MPDPVALSWSGGKDSALALAALRAAGAEVRTLVVTTTAGRLGMHRVRADLVRRQARALGVPVRWVDLPEWPSNAAYDTAMSETIDGLLREGVTQLAFGDVHLADVRAYREERLIPLGVRLLFPLWGRDTRELIDTVLDRGYRAVTVCVDTSRLEASFCGRTVDAGFLADLPDGVDPAGENGEYHTFVSDGPDFAGPVRFRLGAQETRLDRFRYQDLLP
ncbi:MJ0570-related uncharacterized domain-containing protein [Haloechinothrix alba]|uniref:MJ0570-related uncharacterized domain-containing protein n=1 Tax=Haloechinothrix alba TaxID=664784 RepID=A0A239A2A7_9PSEU|nr:hypothetical protein [Haloechinothrix alba]SNR89796.1 MJ0570-related uncharacterized domain-containing protein [Haloechinothrix alba]